MNEDQARDIVLAKVKRSLPLDRSGNSWQNFLRDWELGQETDR
jgi:hypothetical protein